MSKPIKRKTDKKMLAGVCAGIADRFNLEPKTVRIVFLACAAFFIWMAGLPAIIAYIVLAVTLPTEDKRIPFRSEDNIQYPEPTVRYNQSTPSSTQSNPLGKTVDVNNATEQDLRLIPGLTPIQVKELIKFRDGKGGFKSLEDLGDALALKPHVLIQIKPYVKIMPMRRSSSAQNHGRRVDF